MAMLKLLYVEDEPDIREIATLGLNLDPNLEVRTANSGETALAMLQGSDWRPSVILLDLMMPGLDGMTLLSRLRDLPAYIDTPVIFVTARAGAADLNRLVDAGAIGVITKPFDPMTLSSEVRKLLSSN